MARRLLSVCFPHFAAEHALRRLGESGPLAVVTRRSGTVRVVSVNPVAGDEGIAVGMGLTDARTLLPTLKTVEADPHADERFLGALLRMLRRYAPMVARDSTAGPAGLAGHAGLALDITGAAHLMGGEEILADELQASMERLGLTARLAIAESRAGARALALYGSDQAIPIVASGELRAAVSALPIDALRAESDAGDVVQALRGLGLQRIEDVITLPRAQLARRFGTVMLAALDRMTGVSPDPISPEPERPPFAASLRCPEPLGLAKDVEAVTAKLAERVCLRLADAGMGARRMRMQLYRVDQSEALAEIGFARPSRDAERIAALFAPQFAGIDAGFGFDAFRMAATEIEPLTLKQTSSHDKKPEGVLDDLLTRLGNRLGFDRVLRFLPADSQIPERSFTIAAAAYSAPVKHWPTPPGQHPITLFPPEPVRPSDLEVPPSRFRWRRQEMTTLDADGPERIAPEWWWDDPNWRSGVRDYWRVQTSEGLRLWLFFAHGGDVAGGWFATGEFA